MKLIISLILAAVLLILVVFPIVMVWLLGRETFRDVVIIAWGAISIVAFASFFLWILALWSGTNSVVRDVKLVVKDDVKPMLATGRETVNNVTGTTRFVGDTVVSPIIRVYGIIAGVRRGFGVFTGLTRRGRKGRS